MRSHDGAMTSQTHITQTSASASRGPGEEGSEASDVAWRTKSKTSKSFKGGGAAKQSHGQLGQLTVLRLLAEKMQAAPRLEKLPMCFRLPLHNEELEEEEVWRQPIKCVTAKRV